MKKLYRALVILLYAACSPLDGPGPGSTLKPVLIAIANNGFFYQEYADPRLALEEYGLNVVVAAGTNTTAFPHANSGQPLGGTGDTPVDIMFMDVDVNDYAALVIPGGWGATRYYYDFTGTVDDADWQPDPVYSTQMNTLISNFLSRGKTILGVCNGVNVLSWARINGASPLSNRTVCAPSLLTPPLTYGGTHYSNGILMYIFAEDNGGDVQPQNSVGDSGSNTDDVAVDGLIMTAQDNFSAYYGGILLARRLLNL